MTARRPYRRNLLRLGCERAAKVVYGAIRFAPNGGRKAVFVDDAGGISVYPANHPGTNGKPPWHLVGVYGASVTHSDLERALSRRLNRLSGSDWNVRSLGHTT
jgi:hypothetical protein